jgi:hypothetical protein
MAVNEFKMTPPPEWHTPTTGHFQADAGSGLSRRQRAAAVHQGLQPFVPLVGPNVAADFAQEWRAAERPGHLLRSTVVGGVLGYALQRYIQNRRPSR